MRNNDISECEQAGVVGSFGAIFSEVSGNDIHDICVKGRYFGEEVAGIKFHGAIDTLIKGNRIHKVFRGMHMDWMAQGTRVTGNLMYDNSSEDIYFEVDHGPYLIDNNLLLSPVSIWDMSEGGAYAQNLITGRIHNWYDMGRNTPYMHATRRSRWAWPLPREGTPVITTTFSSAAQEITPRS